MDYKEIEIDGERIFMKKVFKNWQVIYPYKVDGKINWKNLIAGGNWWNLLFVAIIVGIVLGCIYEYTAVLKALNDCSSQLPNLNLNPYGSAGNLTDLGLEQFKGDFLK